MAESSAHSKSLQAEVPVGQVFHSSCHGRSIFGPSLPSGHQTWQWKMDLWSVILLWKPPFIGDCPFPCLLTSWKMIYPIIIPASTVFHRDRIVSETCAGLLPSGKRLSGAHKSNSAAHTAKTQPRTQIWLTHAHRSDSPTHTDLTHTRTQIWLTHAHKTNSAIHTHSPQQTHT